MEILQQEESTWAELRGGRLIIDRSVDIKSVKIYDLTMKLLFDLSRKEINESVLPQSSNGCSIIGWIRRTEEPICSSGAGYNDYFVTSCFRLSIAFGRGGLISLTE